MVEYEEEFEELSQEEQAYAIAQAQAQAHLDYPQQEEKASIFGIFKRILEMGDSSKVGNLDNYELYAVRTSQHVSLLMKEIGYDIISRYFKAKGEVLLSTSLSKNAALIQALITQKRQLSTERKTMGDKKKWKKQD